MLMLQVSLSPSGLPEDETGYTQLRASGISGKIPVSGEALRSDNV
jgi:hypothetical protein